MGALRCRECGAFARANSRLQLRCCKCRWHALKVASRAHNLVHKAVRRGALANLKTTVIACADCGGRATKYDHRDYAKPLDVQAVCHGCNLKRGPAARIGVAA